MNINKDDLATLIEFGDAVLKICELDARAFSAGICAAIDTYAIKHELDPESLFEAINDMFYRKWGGK